MQCFILSPVNSFPPFLIGNQFVSVNSNVQLFYIEVKTDYNINDRNTVKEIWYNYVNNTNPKI